MAATGWAADAAGDSRGRAGVMYRRGGASVRALAFLSAGPAAALEFAVLHATLVDDRADTARLSGLAAHGSAARPAWPLAPRSADGDCRRDQRALLRGGRLLRGLVA